MIMRMIGAGLLVCLVTTSGALAQRDTRPWFPPEKFSPHPLQPMMSEAPARLSPAANPEQWPVVQSPWTKYCGKDQSGPHDRSVCITVKEVRLRFRLQPFLVGVALMEATGEDEKTFRVTLSQDDLQQSSAVRMRVDSEIARTGSLRQCRSNRCMWDFPADAAFIALLKSGERLHIQGTAASGEVASYDLPLGGFGRANDGSPIDPATFKEKDRWEERSRNPSTQPR